MSDLAPELIEIRNDGLTQDDLTAWLDAVGPDVLINKKSRTWRELTDDQRLTDPVALILKNPTVMKRPVIVTKDDVLVGWNATTKAALGLD